jgi:SLOG in TRPM, prokaryote
MTAPLRYEFADGLVASAMEVDDAAALPAAVSALGLDPPRPTVTVVGGAGGLDESGLENLRSIFLTGIVPVLQQHNAAAVDGGTRSGVMRLIGETRAQFGASFPLVGVAAAGTVRLPGQPARPDVDTVLEPNHSHFIIVPGDEWGAESPWIADTASVLAGGRPSVTVLINGGEIAYSDVERSVQARRRVVVVAGSGRTADAIAGALVGTMSDDRAERLAGTGLVDAVPLDDPAALATLLGDVIGQNSQA